MAITAPVKDKRAYKIRFVVRGTGEFPLDMLRYDRCYFLLETDARHAEHEHRSHERESHFYALASHQEYKKWEPTAARWASFGFEVCELHSNREFESDLRLRPA